MYILHEVIFIYCMEVDKLRQCFGHAPNLITVAVCSIVLMLWPECLVCVHMVVQFIHTVSQVLTLLM